MSIRNDIAVGWTIKVSDEDAIKERAGRGIDVQRDKIYNTIHIFGCEHENILKMLGATMSIIEERNRPSGFTGTAWFPPKVLVNLLNNTKYDGDDNSITYFKNQLPFRITRFERMLHHTVDFEALRLFDIPDYIFDISEKE